MKLRRINLPGVSYPGESYGISRSYLKGQSNKMFDMFFIIQACLGHGSLSKVLKYF